MCPAYPREPEIRFDEFRVAKSGRVQKLFGRVHELHLDTAGSNERGDQLEDG